LNTITSSASRLQFAPKTEAQDETPLKDANKAADSSAKANESLELTAQELRQVRELQSIDKRVRAHEKAHLNAAAGIAKGGASFTTRVGPDGQQYAVGGEVSIDTSKVAGDPQATIFKARQIQRAAQAPVDPSAQDRAVAASAYALEQQALLELKDLNLLEAQSASNTRRQVSNSGPVDELA